MSAGNKDNGLMEAIAVAALLFLFWKFLRKREQEGIRQAEPPTTPAEFDLNKVCDKIIYEPLSTNDLRQSNLYGPGWCYRGDRSVVDVSAGFGDAYSEKQADDYQQMKQEEAILVNNRDVIQFRLINTGSTQITTKLLNTTQDVQIVDGTDEGGGPRPQAPISSNASGIRSSSFVANWSSDIASLGFLLDVATDIGFTSFVPGYNAKDVGTLFYHTVTGLNESTDYYFRVRSYNNITESDNSSTKSLKTLPSTPVVDSATGILINQFTFNWGVVLSATKYYLDVATDSDFTSFVAGFNNKDTGNVLTYDVTGLTPGINYYARVRSYDGDNNSENSDILNVMTICSAPTSDAATGITEVQFTANWQPVTGASKYYLDVATDIGFTSFVTGYNNKDAGNVTSYDVTGLSSGTDYYYRVRAYNSSGVSASSGTQNVTTARVFNDFFQPSRDELKAMYDQLHLYGLGNFNSSALDCFYGSSSELNATTIWGVQFSNGVFPSYTKGALNLRIRPCRKFTSSTVYSLRDTGEAGGLIFAIIDNGDTTYDYYEAATSDIKPGTKWSNIDNVEIGASAQGTAVSTGAGNSNAIVGQVGHTSSHAKLCHDLTISG